MRVPVIILTFIFLLVPALVNADYSDGLHAYLQGRYNQALEEFKPLARDGDPKAQYILGSMYAAGKGVLQDYVQAHAWFNLAAAQGHDKAALYREEIAGKMTSGQIAKAQQLAGKLRTPSSQPDRKEVNKKTIVQIQKHLRALGYYSGTIDGLMGPNTSASIRLYQRDHDLPVTGEPSASLLEKIEQTAGQKTMKRLADVPEGPWTKILLHDDFTDGDYTRNPAWTRSSGDFWVDSDHFLRTERPVPQAQQTGEKAGGEKKAMEIFGQVVKQVMGPEQGGQSPTFSELYSDVEMAGDFALNIDMQMLSEIQGQSFEFGAYQGRDRSSGYLLRFVQQDQQSLALIRFGRSGSSVIDVVRQTGLLQKNKSYALSWLRYSDGQMKVLIDQREVLSTKDAMFDDFDGVTFINQGGNYAISSISVLGPGS